MLQSNQGQGLVEYLIIVALVAVATIGVVKVLGQTVKVQFARIAKGLGAEVEGQGRTTLPKISEAQLRPANLKHFLQPSKDSKADESEGEE